MQHLNWALVVLTAFAHTRHSQAADHFASAQGRLKESLRPQASSLPMSFLESMARFVPPWLARARPSILRDRFGDTPGLVELQTEAYESTLSNHFREGRSASQRSCSDVEADQQDSCIKSKTEDQILGGCAGGQPSCELELPSAWAALGDWRTQCCRLTCNRCPQSGATRGALIFLALAWVY